MRKKKTKKVISKSIRTKVTLTDDHYSSTPHHRRFVRSITNSSGGVGFMSLVMRGLSPPVIVEPAVMGGASPPVKKPLFRTGGDDYFPTKKNIFRYQ